MTNILKVENLSLSFDGILAVNNFSAYIETGSIVGLIGPNGAGKTTLFNIIGGYLPAVKGNIYYYDQSIKGWAPCKIAATGIARTFQDMRLITRLTVMENLLLSRPKQSGEKLIKIMISQKGVIQEEKENSRHALEILDFIGLEEKKNFLASELSYGQQKLLTLGCCLATQAELFLLDEPVSGVHTDMIEKILDLLKKLKELGKTVLFIEHNIEAVMSIADKVIVMDDGQKIAEDIPSLILNKPEILEAYLE